MVFVAGNNLPARLARRKRMVIGELGFGTGLSMLATYQVARESSCHVQFLSVEAHPLSRQESKDALTSFPEIDPSKWLEVYPEPRPGPGIHHFDLEEKFSVTLVIDEVSAGLSSLDGQVDAWYLDGFAPAKNPGMWSDCVFSELARLSAPRATLASYTAAGEVRRGLERAGFSVSRLPGFGRKRHRIVGSLKAKPAQLRLPRPPDSVAIIGAGIAGICASYALRRRGIEVAVFDSTPSQAASRNPKAILSPRINRLDDPASRWQVRAFEYASRFYSARDGFERCGVFRVAVDDELRDRFSKGLYQGPLQYGPSQLLDAREASEVTGVSLTHGGVWLPEGGEISPDVLFRQLLSRSTRNEEILEIRRSFDAFSLLTERGQHEFEGVVVAAGAWAHKLLPTLPFRGSRGQLEVCRAGSLSRNLRCVLSGHGYLTPLRDNLHVLGATYGRADASLPVSVRETDSQTNFDRFRTWAPMLANDLVPVSSRTALRSLVPDHMPVVGRMGGVFVLSALGSRGFTLAPLASEVLGAEMCGGIMPLAQASRNLISPMRYPC